MTSTVRSGIPIVVIHRGVYESVKWALRQAVTSNPTSSIFLISELSSIDVPGITCVPMVPHEGSANQFEQSYVHMSNYSREFELQCFRRWFVLLDFMTSHKLEQVFHIDSDVLLFSDITTIHQHYRHSDCTLAFGKNGACAHASYFNSSWIVGLLCELISRLFQTFQSEALLNAFKAFISNEMVKLYGLDKYFFPLNDMRALTQLRDDPRCLVQNSTEILESATFDYAMLDSQSGYKLEADGQKHLVWNNGLPTCWHERLKIFVKFHALHYQGGVRGMMKADFCRAQGLKLTDVPEWNQ